MSAPTSQSQNTNNSGLNFLANVAANVDFVGEVIFWDKNLNRSRDEEKDPSPVARETGVAFVQEESSENTGSNQEQQQQVETTHSLVITQEERDKSSSKSTQGLKIPPLAELREEEKTPSPPSTKPSNSEKEVKVSLPDGSNFEEVGTKKETDNGLIVPLSITEGMDKVNREPRSSRGRERRPSLKLREGAESGDHAAAPGKGPAQLLSSPPQKVKPKNTKVSTKKKSTTPSSTKQADEPSRDATRSTPGAQTTQYPSRTVMLSVRVRSKVRKEKLLAILPEVQSTIASPTRSSSRRSTSKKKYAEPKDFTEEDLEPDRPALSSTSKNKRKRDVASSATTQKNPERITPPPNCTPLPRDPNAFYVEEEAYLYHDPPMDVKDLPALPPPPGLPKIPNTGHCKWTWDEEQRVLLGDFSKSSKIDSEDRLFLLQMYERDDITVISEGLLKPEALNGQYWSRQYLTSAMNGGFYHKFRRFDAIEGAGGTKKIQEMDKFVSMQMESFFEYLNLRSKIMGQAAHAVEDDDSADRSFSFKDDKGVEHVVKDVSKTALYMIDADLPKLFPKTFQDFKENFRVKDILPGGSYCMMHPVSAKDRNFMGPNLYMTPPLSFTHFHQDGHGTVDSGHLCMGGFNEVVILRRIPTRHKVNALSLLTKTRWDGLFREPHDDQMDKPAWPSTQQIEACREMGYCPTVCILKPGQHIHINKGRLHAFRKMSLEPLLETDCHFDLRQAVVDQHELKTESLCTSVAWDWMYRGFSAEGIARETSTILESSYLCRPKKLQCLGNLGMCLFEMARTTSRSRDLTTVPSLLDPSLIDEMENISGNDLGVDKARQAHRTEASSVEICNGLLPCFEHLVDINQTVYEVALRESSVVGGREKVFVREDPDVNRDQKYRNIHDSHEYSCKICNSELSNAYYQCNGCAKLVHKHYNICHICHSQKRFKVNQDMTKNKRMFSQYHHRGNNKFSRKKGDDCVCKTGKTCPECSLCSGCSCSCHESFTLCHRLLGPNAQRNLLAEMRDHIAGKPLEHYELIKGRLDRAFAMSLKE